MERSVFGGLQKQCSDLQDLLHPVKRTQLPSVHGRELLCAAEMELKSSGSELLFCTHIEESHLSPACGRELLPWGAETELKSGFRLQFSTP